MGPAGDSPAVFSSETLALSIEDVVLNPQYSAQMASFAKHLIGEFNVEGLLFFLRVNAFQSFVAAGKSIPKVPSGSAVNGRADVGTDAQEGSENSRFSEEAEEHSVAVQNADDVDVDTGVAWKALLVYFEFLAKDSPAQVNRRSCTVQFGAVSHQTI